VPSTTVADKAMHSLQMYAPGPATSVCTIVSGLPQNEQDAMTFSAGVSVVDTWFSSWGRMLRKALA
jgi:hypothetical protein